MKHYETPTVFVRNLHVEDVLTASDGIILDGDGWGFTAGETQEVFFE